MNFSKIPIAIILLLLLGAGVSFGEQEISIKDSIDRIYEVASSKRYYNLTEKERGLIREIADFGPNALPYLMELLDHPKREVTVVAVEAIEEIAGEVESIDPKFLPAILHGLDNDHSGLPNVLAKVKTTEARTEFVQRYLADSSSPWNQYLNGFARYGADFLPHIIEAIIADNGSKGRTVYLLGEALKEFRKSDREIAALEIFKAFDDVGATVEAKRALLGLIGNLGEAALPFEDKLIAIREDQPDLTERAAKALVGIRSKKAGVILGERLTSNPHYLLLRDIAEVGEAARDAGGAVAKLLDDSDWQLRLGAARTIGFIGYQTAVPRLIELLFDPTDVRVNFVVAESLGRLGSVLALDPLRRTARDHWHPAVREAAEIAVDKIESGSKYELKSHTNNFSFEYFKFQYMGMELPKDFQIPSVVEPVSLKLYAKRDPERLAELSYTSEIVGYSAFDEEEQKARKGEDSIIVVNEDNRVEHRRKIPQVPHVALRVHNGWLLGSDRGEWGGELVFMGDDKKRYYILEDNIDELFKLGDRFIAVTGLAHLTLNNGMIYEVKFHDSKWHAEPWRALPGAPKESGKLKSGEVMVVTYGGGVLILSENGRFRMADKSLVPSKAMND